MYYKILMFIIIMYFKLNHLKFLLKMIYIFSFDYIDMKCSAAILYMSICTSLKYTIFGFQIFCCSCLFLYLFLFCSRGVKLFLCGLTFIFFVDRVLPPPTSDIFASCIASFPLIPLFLYDSPLCCSVIVYAFPLPDTLYILSHSLLGLL